MPIDWTASMQQTFEYYVVDPVTWKDTRKLDTILSCTVERDTESLTRGSVSISTTEELPECYIREYLIARQNGETYKIPLGTHILQTPKTSFDGSIKKLEIEGYTPLIELKEKLPPLGYYIKKGENILDITGRLTAENCRAQVVTSTKDTTMFEDYAADTSETWLDFLSKAVTQAKYHYDLDEYGRILFAPTQELVALQPTWTFDDGNSSILYPDVDFNCDIYGIPNVIEVSYSASDRHFYSRVVNDDSDSPTSIQARGREIVVRETNPSIGGNVDQTAVDDYARTLLETRSTLSYDISFSHGYCPVRVGDCVRLNYDKAGINNIRAVIKSQSIECTSGCKVDAEATYYKKLWYKNKY